MMLNLIKVKFLGGEAREFGGEASPLSPPLDETLGVSDTPFLSYNAHAHNALPW